MKFLKNFFRPRSDHISVIVASDDGFLPHMTVMLKSAEENLAPGYHLDFYIFHNGIEKEKRVPVVNSLCNNISTLYWIELSEDILSPFNVKGHVNEMTYFRILAPSALPDSVSKAIYLDSDIVVLGSLHELWNISMEESEIMACQDVTVPFMNAEMAMDNFELSEPFLSKTIPLKYFEELEIPANRPYFNGGVLVLDVARWKSNDMTKVLIKHLIEFKSKNTFWDQDALNALFWNKCKFISPQWNQTAHIFRFPSFETSPLGKREFDAVLNDAKLIHFSTRSKPWHKDCAHPLKELYHEYLQKTLWK